MSIRDYFDDFMCNIEECGFILTIAITFKEWTPYSGIIKGRIEFSDESELFFVEVVDTRLTIEKLKYSFHYQKKDHLVFRYDNAPHHRQISSFPHHKHTEKDGVTSSTTPNIKHILNEIGKNTLEIC